MPEDTQSKLDSGNACYNSEENILSSRSLSGNMKIKIHGTITLPVVPYGYKTWPLTLSRDCGAEEYINFSLSKPRKHIEGM